MIVAMRGDGVSGWNGWFWSWYSRREVEFHLMNLYLDPINKKQVLTPHISKKSKQTMTP